MLERTTSTRFSDLPTELHLQIWKDTLPLPRFVHCNLEMDDPITALQVSHESRQIALKFYSYEFCFGYVGTRKIGFVDAANDLFCSFRSYSPSISRNIRRVLHTMDMVDSFQTGDEIYKHLAERLKSTLKRYPKLQEIAIVAHSCLRRRVHRFNATDTDQANPDGIQKAVEQRMKKLRARMIRRGYSRVPILVKVAICNGRKRACDRSLLTWSEGWTHRTFTA